MSKSLAFLVVFLFLATTAHGLTDEELTCMRNAAAAFRTDRVGSIADGCVPRASSFYTFLVNRCPSLNGRMSNTQLNGVMTNMQMNGAPAGVAFGCLRPQAGIYWRYHFALSFTHNGTLHIIDPSFSGDEMTFNSWVDLCGPTNGTTSTTTARASIALASSPPAPTRTTPVRTVRTTPAPPTTTVAPSGESEIDRILRLSTDLERRSTDLNNAIRQRGLRY